MNNSGRTSNADAAVTLQRGTSGRRARPNPMWKTNYLGRAAKENFLAWGSAQAFEKARFGEGNPRIFLG